MNRKLGLGTNPLEAEKYEAAYRISKKPLEERRGVIMFRKVCFRDSGWVARDES